MIYVLGAIDRVREGYVWVVRRLVRLATIGLTIAAISQEMQRAPSDRTWTGVVFGVVPYDFRPPTWERSCCGSAVRLRSLWQEL